MTLTKREKLLLQVFISIAAFGIIFVFLLIPQLETHAMLELERDDLLSEYKTKDKLLNNTEIDNTYKKELELAKKNYDYFYSVLNSYTIDGIVNKLIQEYNLNVFLLNIGDYEPAVYDFQKVSEEEIEILVKSTVNINVSGTYENILKLIDALNEKSTCLRVDTISITPNEADATGTQGMTAAFRIYIYGIDARIEGIDTAQ